jgi:opacity protein-like surface antigen
MKKALLVLFSLLILSAGLFAQYGDEKRIEFSILGGYGIGSLNGTSFYSDSWGDFFTDDIFESTDIILTNKNTFSFGANFSYFFTPSVGVQIGGGYFAPKADIAAEYLFDWSSSFFGDSDTVSGTWGTTDGAQLTSIPIYLNLVARYRGSSFSVYGTAGPTLFINKFTADSYSIFGAEYFFALFLDYFQIPLMISESWTAFGFNVGAGFQYDFSPSVGFLVEGRYFFAPKKDFLWTWETGTYSGVPYSYAGGYFNNWIFTDFSDFMDLTSPLTVNPSFFTIMGGFTFHF